MIPSFQRLTSTPLSPGATSITGTSTPEKMFPKECQQLSGGGYALALILFFRSRLHRLIINVIL
jgi:hypothetical protein